jgi:hypothetical protein
MSSTDEKHGIAVEHATGSETDTKPVVPVGHGDTTKLEGAKLRKVYNVSCLSSRPSTPS